MAKGKGREERASGKGITSCCDLIRRHVANRIPCEDR